MANYSKGESTRQHILDVAAGLFYRKGYLETSFNEICREAGVNNGLMVYHFGTKAHLAGEIYKQLNTSQIEPIRAAFPTIDPITLSILSLYSHYRLFYADANYRRFSAEVNEARAAGGTPEELWDMYPTLYEGSLKFRNDRKTQFFLAADVGLAGDIETFLLSHLAEYSIEECVAYTSELYLSYIDDDFLADCLKTAQGLQSRIHVENEDFRITIRIDEA